MNSRKVIKNSENGLIFESWVGDDNRLHRLNGPAKIITYVDGSQIIQHWINGVRVPDKTNPYDGPVNFWPEIVNGDLGIWSDRAEDGSRPPNPRCVINRHQVTREVWFYFVRGLGLDIQPEPIDGAQA